MYCTGYMPGAKSANKNTAKMTCHYLLPSERVTKKMPLYKPNEKNAAKVACSVSSVMSNDPKPDIAVVADSPPCCSSLGIKLTTRIHNT